MTPLESLDFLNEILKEYSGNREEHIKIINAYETIKQAIQAK